MSRPGRLGLVRALCAGVAAASLVAAGCGSSDDEGESAGATATEDTFSNAMPADPDQPLNPSEERGQALFAAGCGSCHTLEAAGTTGQVGPNLDELDPDEARVLRAIRVGGEGSGTMPRGIYRGREAEQVARFVAEN
jgi:mono/diheme cytochrome c family protein